MSIVTAACKAAGPVAASPAACSRQAAAPSSSTSSRCSSRRPCRAACRRAAWAPPPRRLSCQAAAEEAAPEAEEEEEEDRELTWDEKIDVLAQEEEHLREQSGAVPYLKVSQQRGLKSWQPGAQELLEQQQQQAEQGQREQRGAAAAAAPAGEAAPATFEELLAQLPGLQRIMRDTAQERSGLIKAPERDPWTPDQPFRYPRPEEPELSEWDLRAKMEKRRRQQRAREAWDARRAEAGRYPSLGADWRTDVRCQQTGDPTDPAYREWTHKEIWDLITLNGQNADPREVVLWVRDPNEIADAPSQGGKYTMDPEEYFESVGALIREEELAAIAGSAGGTDGDADGASLLAAEFSNFDDGLGDFDADYGAGGGGGGGDDDDF
ncbi:hypothetical protein ABPG75_008019 [Micractinium tetrahymenae]